MASALVVGAGAASTALWYYSRRYVGELALLHGQPGTPPRVRISVLDFWGNREVRPGEAIQGRARRSICLALVCEHTPALNGTCAATCLQASATCAVSDAPAWGVLSASIQYDAYSRCRVCLSDSALRVLSEPGLQAALWLMSRPCTALRTCNTSG